MSRLQDFLILFDVRLLVEQINNRRSVWCKSTTTVPLWCIDNRRSVWCKSTTTVPLWCIDNRRSVWCKSTKAVPSRWRSTMTDLWAMPYYHGLLDNQDIEELLTQEGDFAVVKKTPENGAELYAIAVRTQEEVTYQLFMERNGRIGIDFKKHQIRHRAFTQKTDVWAFGVLSWEVFSDGASPFHGVQQASVVEKILGGERLIFPEQAPSVFAAFVGENIWQDEHNKRLSMGAVFDWLDRHINKMA